MHDVRPSYASAALAAGIPAKVVSERLGHGSRAGQSGQGQRAGGRRVFKAGGFPNKKAADAWKDDEAKLRGGTWLDPRAGEIPLREYFQRFYSRKEQQGREA